jgi:hypothetical protein
MSVCCECCVLSGRGLCDELVTRPEESYRLRYVFVCDLENPMHEEARSTGGLSHQKNKSKSWYLIIAIQSTTRAVSVAE